MSGIAVLALISNLKRKLVDLTSTQCLLALALDLRSRAKVAAALQNNSMADGEKASKQADLEYLKTHNIPLIFKVGVTQ